MEPVSWRGRPEGVIPASACTSQMLSRFLFQVTFWKECGWQQMASSLQLKNHVRKIVWDTALTQGWWCWFCYLSILVWVCRHELWGVRTPVVGGVMCGDAEQCPWESLGRSSLCTPWDMGRVCPWAPPPAGLGFSRAADGGILSGPS